ncbi:MAG TPA: TetR/AcrR family transcriptional regulator [Candidatus Merdenecus merdavium]|nr:TetR/AcrR family transcriptional regulator [Candidatus Merdenecus merdavium]
MKPSEHSKESLALALIYLMEKKDYNDITVTDLAKRAGVSRLTFYRNFETKEQILVWHIEKGFQEYMDSLVKLEKMDLSSALILCFEFWNTRKKEILIFIQQNMSYIFLQPFDRCMVLMLNKIGVAGHFTETQKQFLIGGMFMDMITWIQTGQKKSPHEVTKEILEMFSPEFLFR